MNDRGFGLILIILLAFIAVLLLPTLALHLFPTTAGILLKIIIVLMIVSTVQGFLGSSKLSWIITIILVVIALRHIEIISATYMFYIVLTTGVSSMIVWGLGTMKH